MTIDCSDTAKLLRMRLTHGTNITDNVNNITEFMHTVCIQ